jgi:predicted YcjX-like family ATPase
MENNDIGKVLSKGYYVTLGAIATLVDTLQSEPKRQQAVSSLQSNIEQLLQELANKGVSTEAEARSYVDRLVSPPAKEQTVETQATSVPSDDIAELKELTQQVAELRAELAKMQDASQS